MGMYVVDEANIESHGVDFNWSTTLANKDVLVSTQMVRAGSY